MMHLHPSVIMSISEHHSRTKATRPEPEIVIGALLGKKLDHNAEIIDSFELRAIGLQDAGDNLNLDKKYFQEKLSLVKQVSPDLDVIGWYSTASPTTGNDSISQNDIQMHKQISEIIPNPILVKLNPYKREDDPKISGALPLKIYEPVIEIIDGREHCDLIEVVWTISTDDVEIIGLEHNSKMTHNEFNPSAAIDYLRLQHSAVKMLRDRIRLISKFVRDVQSGVLVPYDEPLTDIANLCRRFPLMNSEEYAQAYNIQCNDVALNTYLGILTKGSVCKLNFGRHSSKTRAYPSTHARR